VNMKPMIELKEGVQMVDLCRIRRKFEMGNLKPETTPQPGCPPRRKTLRSLLLSSAIKTGAGRRCVGKTAAFGREPEAGLSVAGCQLPVPDLGKTVREGLLEPIPEELLNPEPTAFRLRRRTWLERLIRAPRVFWDIFRIGRGKISLRTRLFIACAFMPTFLRSHPRKWLDENGEVCTACSAHESALIMVTLLLCLACWLCLAYGLMKATGFIQ